MSSAFEDALDRKVLILDGAMGTMIQSFHLPLSDYEGLENCSEILNVTRPDVIQEIHEGYLAAGCDGVETNTFGANRIVFAEFGLVPRVYEINKLAAEIARRACDKFSTREQPRFVVGSAGPGTRLPTLGHITYDELFESYREQGRGLLDGGVDAILVETCQDLLQAKCAVAATLAAMEDRRRTVPLMAQVTMEATGTMLLGSDVGAAVTALSAFPLVTIGINCATGPQEMSEHVKYLADFSPLRISVLPNAGLPQLVDGKTLYPLTPEDLARWLVRFVEEDGVAVVGGCCGTTWSHLEAVVKAVGSRAPKRRDPDRSPKVSSLYSSIALEQDASVLIVGERTNANGSKRFRRLLEEGDVDGMVEMAREQVKEGSHVLDVCTAYVGRDEVADMKKVLRRFVTDLNVPLMIDSTEAPVIEEALKLAPGKCIVNSVNFEDGEERCRHVLPLARKFGAAVIGLTIDEDGMAKTADKKLEIARRLRDTVTGRYGLPPGDLIIDPLTFTICTGNEDDRKLGEETLVAIERIRRELPDVHTLLGLSNISFGLNPGPRHLLNSVYLHHARERGLSSAIVHAAGIVPLYKVPERERRVAEDLIFDRRREGYDPLQELIGLFAGKTRTASRAKEEPKTVEERLKNRIVEGARKGIEADLELALATHPPLEIINEILLDGMKVVGELFASGEMQLPFVLQSAETMKASVAWLEPKMERAAGSSKGRIVLATVRGDVHDIGKNLVDIILTNNGYTVVNLGIKQPIHNILEAAKAHDAHAIGLSGLLVKSTVIMKENLAELARQGVTTPVLLGGAALTRKYVEEDCRREYPGRVDYAKDAFDGLRLMGEIRGGATARAAGAPAQGAAATAAGDASRASAAEASPPAQADRPLPYEEDAEYVPVRRDVPVPAAPFFGSRVIEKIPLRSVLPYLNEAMLFVFQWGFHRKGRSPGQYDRFLDEHVRPAFRDLLKTVEAEGILAPRAVYGFWPCWSEGEDLVVLDEHGGAEIERFTFPRQSKGRRRSIADFFRPKGSDRRDVVGFHMVTVGQEASDTARAWFAENRYRDYLYLHGLSVECAEATAELVHKQIRAELGISADDSRSIEGLFHQGYRGSRYSFGYPACPNLEDQAKLMRLLRPERIGITLSEEFQLHPEQSTSAIIVHHPEARYFRV